MRYVKCVCFFFAYSLYLVLGDVAMDLKHIKECNSTSPVSLPTLNRVLINKKLSGGETNNFKCFLHCLFTKYAWMDDEGGFLLHEMKRVLDETELDAITIEYVLFVCTAMNSVDKCERAFVFVECFWKKTYQGTVIATNAKLCSFILDDDVKINIPHLMLHKKQRALPHVGETVRICGHYHHSEELHKHVFLCGKSTLICNDSSGDSSTIDYSLLNVIENQNLGIIDLEKAYVNNKVIEEFIAGLRGATAEDVIISFLKASQDFIVRKRREQIDSCSESMLSPKVLLRTISDCRFINKTNEKYARFPYWTFGVHPTQPNDILIGYFYLSRHTGIPFFKDTKHRMPCCVLTKTNHDLLKLNNCLILIKKCKVFTEVFNKTGIAPLEYLMFSVDEVIVLNCLPEMESKFLVKRPNVMEFKYNFKFILLKKSSVSWSNKNTPECWLKILIIRNNGNRQEFLALNSTYMEMIAFFQVGETYEVFHDKELSPYFSKEIQRLESRPCLLLSEKSAIFVSSALTDDEHLSLLTMSDSESSILSVGEAQEVIKTSSEILSFQGVILVKEFVDPIESRTATNTVPLGFGTLGSKTHRVLFLSHANTKLTLYLNNWERLQLPLGLIPDMRVLVSNVIPQKSAYLKSTVLTTFTVLGYEPKVEFHSMNLREDFYGQGRVSGLHCCGLIPNRVLFSVRISAISIRNVRITSRCKACSKATPCECRAADVEPTLALTFLAADHSGEALIKTDSFPVLKSVLDLKRRQWSKFLGAIKILGSFDFRGGCNSKCKLGLHEAVHHTIAVATVFSVRSLELHCFNTEQKSELPLLNCIEAKCELKD